MADAGEVTTGPWGPFMDVVMSLAPIAFLLVVTLIPRPLPTTTSLPLSALICWLIRIAYFSASPNAVTAQAFSGALAAVTPVTIVAGAIFLFESMDSASCILWMRFQMQRLTAGHAVAEIMLIGWAFSYLVEGSSGFGTPAALASPILIGMGHPKFETVCCLLLMNVFATVFGAVGTPIWWARANRAMSMAVNCAAHRSSARLVCPGCESCGRAVAP
jgi:lactate permease